MFHQWNKKHNIWMFHRWNIRPGVDPFDQKVFFSIILEKCFYSVYQKNKKKLKFKVPGSQAGIKFAIPMLVVPTSNFLKKSNKVYFLSRSKDNKVWIRWWSQANYSQNQTLFIVNYEGFLIDWIYIHACTHTNLNAYTYTDIYF
jgi:hypothetical protein